MGVSGRADCPDCIVAISRCPQISYIGAGIGWNSAGSMCDLGVEQNSRIYGPGKDAGEYGEPNSWIPTTGLENIRPLRF